VGGSAQTKVVKKLAGGIRTALAQYRELAAFAQFASDLDDATRKQLSHGEKVTELLKQKQYVPLSVADQSVLLFAVEFGYLEDVELQKIASFEAALLDYARRNHSEFMAELTKTGNYNDEVKRNKMAGAKEIKTKIASVQSTQKITKAMEMVATSKMRKTQDRMAASRPYSETIRNVISHVSKATVGYKHPFLIQREVKRVGILVVSTDRGMCGGLNINLFKTVMTEIKQWKDKGVTVELGLIGSKGISFFRSLGLPVRAQLSGLGDNPAMEDLIGVANDMFDVYKDGKVDAVYIAYNKFVNTMAQKPVYQQLIPLPALETDNLEQRQSTWDYLYEPEPKVLLDSLLTRYLESQVYQSVVDNLASEQAARMVAMKAATDNAGNLINDLRLVYNKARQASITNELNEIVAGAAAI